MKTLLIILIVLLAASGLANAQNTGQINGRISLPPTRIKIKWILPDSPPDSVADAPVLLKSSGGQVLRTVRTGLDGGFLFRAVAAGIYTLEYNCYYCMVTRRLAVTVRVRDGEVASTVLPLPSDEIHETVTVAADHTQSVEQISKTVDVIPAQELRDRADFALIDSLSTIPGFRVQQSGGFGRVATIKTRGLRNQDTAVLIDGVRFRDPTAITGDASPFLSDITLTSVDRIEVLRGSGSSLYGTNAIGGVVDLETASAKNGTHGQLAFAAGALGFQRYRGVISHGSKDGRFGINIAAARTFYTKGIDGNDAAHNTNFQTKIDGRPGDKTTFLGSIFYSRADVRLNVNPDTFGNLTSSNIAIINAQQGVNFVSDQDDPDAIQRSHFFSGQFSTTQVLSPSMILSGYYHGLVTRRQNDDGTLGPGFQSASTSIFDGQIHTGHAQVVWANKANTLTSGYEFESEKYRNEGRTPDASGNFFTNAGQSSHTFFVQDLVNLDDDRLQFAGGFRAQRYGLDRPAFSVNNAPYANLALSSPPTAYTFDGSVAYYFRASGTKLRAHVGNGYRVPSLFERFGTFFSNFGTPSFVALGDPGLKPERSIAFDAGIEQTALKERIHLSATYFYTHLTDVMGFGNVVQNIGTTARPFGGYENEKGGIARGGEFSARFKPVSNTELFASYTYTNSLQRTPQVTGTSILSTLGVPTNQFTFVATQRFRQAWVNLDLLATSSYLAPIFSSSTFNTYIYRFRGNRRGDVTGGYTFKLNKDGRILRPYGTVENVFGYEYFENGFRTVGRTARIGLSLGF